MNAQPKCVDCGDMSPPTRTETTLMSTAHGWRLLRVTVPSGPCVLEWYCARCWSKRKERRTGVPAPVQDVRPAVAAGLWPLRRPGESK